MEKETRRKFKIVNQMLIHSLLSKRKLNKEHHQRSYINHELNKEPSF